MKYLSKFLSLFLVGAMLYATGCTDYDQDIKDLNNKVDELEQTLQGQIDPLKADLEDVQTALEQAIKDGEALKAKHEEDVKALQAADAKAQEAIDAALKAMEAGDAAELAEKIANAVKAIETANDEIAKLQTVDKEIKENLKTLEDSLKGTQTDVASLKEIAMQFVTWSANVDGTLATMNTEIEGINESIKSLKGDVESLKVMIQQHDMWIQNAEGRLGNLEEYKAYADEQFELLAKADKDLNDLVANLQTDFADYQKIVNEQLTKAFAEIGENTAKINALTADLEAKYNELVAADKAMQDAIAQHEEWITNAEARINNLQEDIESVEANLEDLQADYDAFKEDVTTRLRNAEGSIGQLQVDVQGLNDKLNEFKAAYDEHIAAYEEFVKKTNEAITDMQAIIDAIIGRVQSIAFVPEYVDGKATINWATFGNRILEGRSVLVYQVYPAECAAAIANTPAVGDVVSPLSFDMTDALKTRGGLDKAPQMNIVGVEGDEDGRLYVTVEARNFGEKFYAGEVEYAASLVLTTENENLASCYTNLVAGKSEAIEMRIMATKDVTLTAVNEGAVFEDVTGNTKVYTQELTYTNIENNPDFISLPGYYLEFSYNGEWYNKLDLRAQCGLEIGDIKMEWSIIAENQMGLILNGMLTTVVNEATGYSEVIYDLQKVNASLIGREYGLAYRYMYPGTDKKISAGSSIRFTKEKANADLGYFEETWNYNVDAKVDAARMNVECNIATIAPQTTDATSYYRTLSRNLADVLTNNLPDDTKLVDVLNGTPDITVYVDDQEYTLEQLNMEVNISAADDKAAIEFVGFMWGKLYNVKAVYSLDNVDVVVKFSVNAIDRERGLIEIELPAKNMEYATDLVLTTEISDNFTAAMAAEADHFKGIETADFLKDVFVTNDYHTCGEHATVNTVNDKVADNTKLVINHETGDVIYAYYSYDDVDVTSTEDDMIVTDLAYVKTVTLWYGQEVKFTKAVNFTAPTAWFVHVPQYVDDAFGKFTTYVQPYYFPNSLYETALEKFDVHKVDLNAAFDIYADGELVTVPVGTKEDVERGVAVTKNGNIYCPEFRLTDVHDIYKDGKGIQMYDNYISYYGTDPYVNVDAKLYLHNSNGDKLEVVNNFESVIDGANDYRNYVVYGYNPINLVDGVNVEKEVTDYGVYTIDLTEMFSMKDRRGHDGKIVGHEMINKGREFGDNFLVLGNGSNGFGDGYYAGDVYGYFLRDEMGVPYGNIIPVDVRFEAAGNDADQLEAKGLLDIDNLTGMVKFYYTSQVDLVRPITITVKINVTTAWKTYRDERTLVIRKKASDETSDETTDQE